MLYVNKAQWCARWGNAMNERFTLERNKIMSRWCILERNKKLRTIVFGNWKKTRTNSFFEMGKRSSNVPNLFKGSSLRGLPQFFYFFLLLTWEKNVLNKTYVSWGSKHSLFLDFFYKTQNDLHRKYNLSGGHAENASSPTISQIERKSMTLFHLQRQGAHRSELIFFNFWKMKCRKKFTFFSKILCFFQLFVILYYFFLERDEKYFFGVHYAVVY